MDTPEANIPALLVRCLQASGLNQKGLADTMGISGRTFSRWLGGEVCTMTIGQGQALAGAVGATDPALAAKVLRTCGAMLQGRGLAPVAQAAALIPAAQPVAPLPAATQAAPQALLDSVVCAAADRVDLPLSQVRSLVAAAFARAQELGLSVEAVARGFAQASPSGRAGPEGGGKGATIAK